MSQWQIDSVAERLSDSVEEWLGPQLEGGASTSGHSVALCVNSGAVHVHQFDVTRFVFVSRYYMILNTV